MLKEAVHLVDMLSCMREIVRHSDKSEDNIGTLEVAQKAIHDFIESIGLIDEQKRKTDQAIMILFREVNSGACGSDIDHKQVAYAEQLLGFVPLKPA